MDHDLKLNALKRRALREKGVDEETVSLSKEDALIKVVQEKDAEYSELEKQHEELKLRKSNINGRQYVSFLIKQTKCLKFQPGKLLRLLQNLKPHPTTELKLELKEKTGCSDLKNLRYRTNIKIRPSRAMINSFQADGQWFYQLEIPTFHRKSSQI